MLGLGVPTLLIILILGGIAFVIGWRHPFAILLTLMVLIPFRDLSIRWMNASTGLSSDWINAISRWWFVIVLALLAAMALRWTSVFLHKRQLPRLRLMDYLLIAVVFVALLHTVFSPNLQAGITSLRGYLQPMLVFVLARWVRPNRRQVRILLLLLLAVGLMMVVFEFWQVIGWNEEVYRARGYIDQSGRLVTPTINVRGERFIRPTSTVSGPNELGMEMLVLGAATALGAYFLKGLRRYLMLTSSLFFLLGLALTFSRSAVLGLIAGSGCLLLMLIIQTRRDGALVSDGRRWMRAVLLVLALFVVIALILAMTGNVERIGNTIANLSERYHIRDTLGAIQYLAKHPQGVGMGMVEPKGAAILRETEALFHVEGSHFQIGMEMGVWGLAIWLAFWGAALVRIWRTWPELQSISTKILAGTAFSGWIGVLVTFLFLPLMQSVSLMVWLWFVLGLAVEARTIEMDWDRDFQP